MINAGSETAHGTICIQSWDKFRHLHSDIHEKQMVDTVHDLAHPSTLICFWVNLASFILLNHSPFPLVLYPAAWQPRPQHVRRDVRADED